MNQQFLDDISSSNEPVLRQCLALVDRLNEAEFQRERNAEARASNTMTAIAIVAGLLAVLPSILDVGNDENTLLLVWLSASILFLAKSAYAGLKALRSIQGLRLTHDLVKEMQALKKIEALRSEISWKRWEIEQRISVANERFFWVSRSHRSLVLSVACLLMMSGILLLEQFVGIPVRGIWAVFSLIVCGIGLLFLDSAAERSGIWTSSEVT